MKKESVGIAFRGEIAKTTVQQTYLKVIKLQATVMVLER